MERGREHRWDPATYLDFVTAEIPAYERLQEELVAVTRGGPSPRTILDLGCGTGETTRRVLAAHPGAVAVGVDESPEMLDAAKNGLAEAPVDLRHARLEDALPPGPFDLVVSALAIHHLDSPGKADLFRRIAAELAPGGQFVLADLVVAEDAAEAAVDVDWEYDLPDTVSAQLGWLSDAGLQEAAVAWAEGDLAVLSVRGPA